jgi:hypothetical protein
MAAFPFRASFTSWYRLLYVYPPGRVCMLCIAPSDSGGNVYRYGMTRYDYAMIKYCTAYNQNQRIGSKNWGMRLPREALRVVAVTELGKATQASDR